MLKNKNKRIIYLNIRTTQVFPKDGVVEHIGPYSEVETIGNPFMTALRTIEPEIKEEDFEVLAPRFRWTTHWCVNGIIGDHTQGTFSGRDFFIIEDVSEHTEKPNLVNMLVSDAIFLGDMKLSPKVRIMMSMEKYQELIKNTKMKKQLTKMNIILYKGNPAEALKCYMNESGYVYGSISSFSYCYGREEIESKYLIKIMDSLRNGDVTGLEHCAYASDEGLRLSAMRNPELVQDKFKEVEDETNKMRGIEQNKDKTSDTSIYGMSACIDDMFTYKTMERYIEYLGGKFSEMQKLKEEYIKARQTNEITKFSRISEMIIRKVGLDKIKEATKEFNDMIKEKQKISRAEKDKKLLENGLITQEEYEDRVTEEELEEAIEK